MMKIKPEVIMFEELALINNLDIQTWVMKTLNQVPLNFWSIPASSSGKYHPACSNGEGGLVIHTKRVVWLANQVCAAWGIFALERDIVLAACILHDVGKAEPTYPQNAGEHPLHVEKHFFSWEEEEWQELIKSCIEFHMGRWTPRQIAKPISEYTLLELAVYTADYLSSRKELSTPKDKRR